MHGEFGGELYNCEIACGVGDLKCGIDDAIDIE
jgi:hypothetical protein